MTDKLKLADGAKPGTVHPLAGARTPKLTRAALEDDLSEFESPRRGPETCIIGRYLDSMDETQRARFKAAFAGDPSRYTTSRIAERLSVAVGVRVNRESVSRHRHGTCCCG